eukprot:TRINITY_DN243_c0_g2_i1.p1 TRINITY_DN243_c0_g2~~TRINITY_DN243_c0_g2_i1.p1  ORF type:complete len:728 (+),score=246.92 TRINITY_DN243_c0_g2_i1:112-2295(+)
MFRTALVLSLGAAAHADAGDPKQSNSIMKVIEMLGDLKAKVELEGKEEKKTYDKFVRFCDETTEEKNDEIKTGKESIKTLEAKIKSEQSEQDKLHEAITGDEGFDATIAETKKKLADDQASRKADEKAYQKANAETEKAISGLDKAIDAMRTSKGTNPSFLQDSETKHEIRAAALLADSLGLGDEDTLATLDAPTQDYNFHSDDIIATLEKLQKEFRDADMKADEDEGKANTAFITSQSALKIQLKTAENGLETATENKATAKANEGQAKKDLEETTKELASDEKYLVELTAMCKEKKDTFDQRKKTREEEAAALEEAKKLMTTASKPKEGLLLEIGSTPERSPAVLEAAEADAEAVESSTGIFSNPIAFWQRSKSQEAHMLFLQKQVRKVEASRHVAVQKKPHFSETQQKLIDMLTEKAKMTKSSRFALLVQKAESSTSADPLKEIKDMISQQIDNLQKLAEERQAKKAKCDKEIMEASEKRDTAAEKVQKLNTELATTEARLAQNKEDIQKLTDEMAAIDAEVKTATDNRKAEADEAKKSIEEAEHGLEATDAAIKVMQDFYSKSAKNKVGLLEQSPADDAPDAGFKNNEANKGSQEASTGVIGMLEVVQSDFKRAISQTKESEKSAITEHKKFLSESEISKAEKTQSKTTKSQFVSEDEDKHEEDEGAMGTQAGVMKSALKELAALDEECGLYPSYEQRKEARAKEIEQLKDAIKMVNGFINRV